jgi:hypothetical protein
MVHFGTMRVEQHLETMVLAFHTITVDGLQLEIMKMAQMATSSYIHLMVSTGLPDRKLVHTEVV